jgi:hypothetical protein
MSTPIKHRKRDKQEPLAKNLLAYLPSCSFIMSDERLAYVNSYENPVPRKLRCMKDSRKRAVCVTIRVRLSTLPSPVHTQL